MSPWHEIDLDREGANSANYLSVVGDEILSAKSQSQAPGVLDMWRNFCEEENFKSKESS